MKLNLSYLNICLIFMGVSLFMVSCKKEETKELFQYGETVRMGDGEARTFVEVDESDTPISVGVKISGAALENLPSEVVYNFEFPASMDILPFDHLTIDWSDHGHDPPGVYDTPHFGFHFYYISKQDRNSIVASDSTKFALAPDAVYIPGNFVQTPGGVQKQGAHWINLDSPEWDANDPVPFTETFLYGTYNGEITFLEPMMTLDYLKDISNATTELKQPEMYPFEGYHPMSYSVSYDSSKDEYTISLSDLKMRQ